MEKVITPTDVQMEIVLTWNVLEGTRPLVSGCDKNPFLALAMLDYALARVRRFITQSDIARELQELPRVALPGGPLA